MLYVGKAKSLRPRVRSYFQRGDTRVGAAQLAERIDDIEVIVTRNEAEALHLEQNLVKRHRPPFNIRLRDDKSFPYIAVTLTDEYPRVMFTRERHRRGNRLLRSVREREEGARDARRAQPGLPVPALRGPAPGRHSGIPCLDFHIDRCFAPCIGAISTEDYGEVIDGVIGFLSGDTQPIQRELEERMREAAASERFEEAARYRNRLFSIRHLADRQAAEKRAVGTVDVIGLAIDGHHAAVQVFPLRDGKMIDRYGFHLENVEGEDAQAVLEAFVLEYYGARAEHPAAGARPPGDRRHRSARGVPQRAARLARRRASARSAVRSAGSSSWPPRTRSSRSRPTPPREATRARRVAALEELREVSTSKACRCGSSASTSPTSRASRSSRR